MADLASDGSGISPYRHSPPFLLYACQSLLFGLALSTSGKRLWRLTTALGSGCLLQFVVWVIIVNTLPRTSFAGRSLDRRTIDIIVWALTVAGSICGGAVGAVYWRVGMCGMAACAGLSFAFSVVMMGDDDLPVRARYSVLVILAVATMTTCLLLRHGQGMIGATAMTGAFLLFLGIDLLTNEIRGMSLGLRYLLDGSDARRDILTSYHPPVTTRVFLALVWLTTALACALQYWLFGDRPFSPEYAFEEEPKDKQSSRADSFNNAEPHPALSDLTIHTARETDHEMQQRYSIRLDGDTSRSVDAAKLRSPTGFVLVSGRKSFSDFVWPGQPPTPPDTLLSSELAARLPSRPPTFNTASPPPHGARPLADVPRSPSVSVSTCELPEQVPRPPHLDVARTPPVDLDLIVPLTVERGFQTGLEAPIHSLASMPALRSAEPTSPPLASPRRSFSPASHYHSLPINAPEQMTDSYFPAIVRPTSLEQAERGQSFEAVQQDFSSLKTSSSAPPSPVRATENEEGHDLEARATTSKPTSWTRRLLGRGKHSM